MTAIEFDHVGKMYRLGRVGTGTLSHDLNRWWQTQILRREDPYIKIGEANELTLTQKQKSSPYVWALKDVSFKVEQGEVVGIIGKNGAGKSTLLKLLSKITIPTTGIIRHNGRVASLLEVGTGFHPEMTGRENIFMNGCIMGMTRHEITQKLDAIVDFAGVERYLDTPVKRYSSGMTVRLGFAVAAFLEPEILVVDEVLAVGDAEFQKKALGKMQDVAKGEGRTVLFVSHNLQAVKGICQRSVVLESGQLVFDGSASSAVDFYRKEGTVENNQTIAQGIKWIAPFLKISNIELNGTTSPQSKITFDQEYLDLLLEGETSVHISTIDLRLEFRSLDGTILASLAEGHYRKLTYAFEPGPFRIIKRIILPKFLSSGDYLIDIVLHDPNRCLYMQAFSCAVLHAEGRSELNGDPLICSRDGIIGLESLQ